MENTMQFEISMLDENKGKIASIGHFIIPSIQEMMLAIAPCGTCYINSVTKKLSTLTIKVPYDAFDVFKAEFMDWVSDRWELVE